MSVLRVFVGAAVAAARPDVIVQQMTAISMPHSGKPDIRHFDRWFAPTNRLRTEGTDHLPAAAEATGVSHAAPATGCGAGGEGRVQHRRRRTGAGQ
ncbi:hypothetical protein [Streptomyces sp. SD31]|uniref:hypothetical protein n=1 Tax=Streptomyces sp. SD31 TaxID=3452208 RepID=UPI003F890CE8